MKIAIIQPGHDDFGLGAFYQRAFAALGHDVLSLAPLPPHDPAPATRLLRRAQAAWPGYLESRWSQILDQLIAARPQIVIFTRCETAPAGMIERVDELTGGACWNIYSDPPLMYPGPAALR